MTTEISLGSWLAQARKRLAESSEQPGIESTAIAAHVLGRDRAWVRAYPEYNLSSSQSECLGGLLERLVNGEPLAYLIQKQEFFGFEFFVSPAVLIPRPETELLVEQARDWCHAHPGARSGVDIGTGSGCIAIAISKVVKNFCFTAADRSHPALQVASQNVIRHALTNRIHLVQADLLTPFQHSFDLVCANLPYIPSWKLPSLSVSRHEPALALDGGANGLELIARLIADLPTYLTPGGLALLEIEAGQGEAALELAHAQKHLSAISILPDLAGLPRVLRMIKSDD
jgi:release factor glutamine methyltransferase